jgi:adenine-specific DNA-methyltransferase
MRTLPDRLEDWGYKVSTGPLVWNRHKDQLRDQSGTNHIPLIWAESVTADGRFLFRSEKRNHQPYFMPRSGKDDWLLIHRPCVLLQRTTAKEQHRRLIAAAMPADFLQEHGVAVSAYELESLPLPSADEINSLRLPGKSESSRSRFEQACSHLYGLKG